MSVVLNSLWISIWVSRYFSNICAYDFSHKYRFYRKTFIPKLPLEFRVMKQWSLRKKQKFFATWRRRRELSNIFVKWIHEEEGKEWTQGVCPGVKLKKIYPGVWRVPFCVCRASFWGNNDPMGLFILLFIL